MGGGVVVGGVRGAGEKAAAWLPWLLAWTVSPPGDGVLTAVGKALPPPSFLPFPPLSLRFPPFSLSIYSVATRLKSGSHRFGWLRVFTCHRCFSFIIFPIFLNDVPPLG